MDINTHIRDCTIAELQDRLEYLMKAEEATFMNEAKSFFGVRRGDDVDFGDLFGMHYREGTLDQIDWLRGCATIDRLPRYDAALTRGSMVALPIGDDFLVCEGAEILEWIATQARHAWKHILTDTGIVFVFEDDQDAATFRLFWSDTPPNGLSHRLDPVPMKVTGILPLPVPAHGRPHYRLQKARKARKSRS